MRRLPLPPGLPSRIGDVRTTGPGLPGQELPGPELPGRTDMPDYEAEYQPVQAPLRQALGLTARQAGLLAKLEITTPLDLLRHVPFRYEDWTELVPLASLSDGELAVFRARIAGTPTVRRRGRLSTVRVKLADETATIGAIWFNQPWLAEKLEPGAHAVFRGRIRRTGGRFEVTNPAIESLGDGNVAETAYLHPVYPLTAGLTRQQLERFIGAALTRFGELIPEALPAELRRRHRLADVAYAYRIIHQPPDGEQLAAARRRLAFEELFMLQTGLALLRRTNERGARALPLLLDEAGLGRYRAVVTALPFAPTRAQQRVANEIYLDLTRTRPMARLVQGDVGSGKTLVAALAMLQAVLCGHQAVLMAPTAVLALQHERTLRQLLGDKARILLLTGSTPAGERRTILREIRTGDCDIVVGTHAVIEDRVVFRSLALAVTDEQHRFGVRQRLRLAGGEEGQESETTVPHVLVMSATPIPRTLGLILYGDLDISRIDEMPAGRQPVMTYTVSDRTLARAWALLRRELESGAQGFVVCPTIRAGEEEGRRSVEATYEELSSGPFADRRVGLLHGDLPAKEKAAVMDSFMGGEVELLVATTVIEVGIDQPNATVMLIMDADRFGLAQLHQLRGRIGRGERRSFCLLHSEREDETARARLTTLCRTTDGFEIAEADLQMRGPGDFFGTRQHGLPRLRVANLYEDASLLQEAQQASAELLERDPGLQDPANRRIRPALHRLFGLEQAQMGL
ncbi:MAG: ATP-dependent DNA helicase RecG [Bacillota bacterium]|nr:ATP-dependent DNA helicase RecG [Bacillota bacterium]